MSEVRELAWAFQNMFIYRCGSGGGAVVQSSEGQWFNLYAKVSLNKILNPKLQCVPHKHVASFLRQPLPLVHDRAVASYSKFKHLLECGEKYTVQMVIICLNSNFTEPYAYQAV